MRRSELDLCRIAACMMVLLIHCGASVYFSYPIVGPSFTALMSVATFPRGSVPVFFMLSGTLLLERQDLPLRSFLKKHPFRLFGLFFFWSAFYALGGRISTGNYGPAYLFFYDLVQGHYHLWFIPAMIVFYLFLPPVHSALHGQKLDLRYFLFLFFIFGLLFANFNLTPEPAYILNRFTLNFSFDYLPYLGYGIWGYYLSRREFKPCWRWIAPLIFLLTTALATAGNVWYSFYKNEADGWLFSYFSIFSFVQASSFFCFFLSLRGLELPGKSVLRYLADCSLGVYLVHPLIINVFDKLGFVISSVNPVSSLLLYTAAVAAMCFALTALARKIPFVKLFF